MKRKRYSIMAVEQGRPREVELCQCDSNPEAIVAAAREQTVMLAGVSDRRKRVAKFAQLRVVDHQQDDDD